MIGAVDGVEVQHSSCFTSVPDGWTVNTTPQLLYPWARTPEPIVLEAGWASRQVWIGVETIPCLHQGFEPRLPTSLTLYITMKAEVLKTSLKYTVFIKELYH
jgi:hypothetical protein